MYSGAILDYKDLPEELAEHILAKAYGWTWEYISRLPPKKFRSYIGICLAEIRLQKINGS